MMVNYSPTRLLRTKPASPTRQRRGIPANRQGVRGGGGCFRTEQTKTGGFLYVCVCFPHIHKTVVVNRTMKEKKGNCAIKTRPRRAFGVAHASLFVSAPPVLGASAGWS